MSTCCQMWHTTAKMKVSVTVNNFSILEEVFFCLRSLLSIKINKIKASKKKFFFLKIQSAFWFERKKTREQKSTLRKQTEKRIQERTIGDIQGHVSLKTVCWWSCALHDSYLGSIDWVPSEIYTYGLKCMTFGSLSGISES